MLLGFSVAASIIWPLGRRLNRKQPERELLDLNTGEKVILPTGRKHTFFFVPMEYWAPLFVVIGTIALFAV